VVDLGCAPGSWFAYAAEIVGPGGVVVGVDLDEPAVRPPWAKVIVGSALDVAPEVLLEALGGPADVVLSDMAPRTTGDPTGDHFVQVELATRALGLAQATLAPGGAFVCKVFDGQDAPGFVDAVRASFGAVRRFKPEAVRGRSREFFVVGTGLTG
jgi:23S rRNA (uridine2552-2'-O)-methyltransferase